MYFSPALETQVAAVAAAHRRPARTRADADVALLLAQTLLDDSRAGDTCASLEAVAGQAHWPRNAKLYAKLLSHPPPPLPARLNALEKKR